MRNILFGIILCFGLLVPGLLSAQPDTLWSAQVSVGGTSTLYAATAVSDGYVAVGYAMDGGNRDMLVTKISDSGEVAWTRLLGTVRNEEGWGVVQTSNGNLFVAGFGVDASNTRTVVVVAGLSAAGDSLWWRNIAPATGQCKSRDAALLSDGNVGVVGYRLGANGTTSDMWLLKCTPAGDTLWTRMYGGDMTDVGYRICERSDGGLAMIGTTGSYGGGNDDPWLVLTDASGMSPISLTFGTTGQQYANACAASPNNEVFVGGRGSSNSGPAFVAKCSATGDTLWMNYYSQAATAQVKGMMPELDGGVVCVGEDVYGGVNGWLMGVGIDGGVGWTWTTSLADSFNGIIATVPRGGLAYGASNGNGYLLRLGPPSGIAGTVTEILTGQPLPDVYVSTLGSTFAARSDALGNYALVRSPGTYTLCAYGPCVETDTFQTVTTYADSVLQIDLVMGAPDYVQTQTSLNITAWNQIPTQSPFMIRNQGSGVLEFEIQPETISPPTDWLQFSPAIGTIAAGESLAVGVIVTIDTTNDGAYDIYGYLHLRSNSCPDSLDDLPVLVTILGAEDRHSAVPASFSLSAYPNPFNPGTSISFSVPRESDVQLEVFNVTGQLVRQLVRGRIQPGIHRIAFDGSDLPSGLYVARLQSADFTKSQKLLLLK